jgi:hypothetical protein
MVHSASKVFKGTLFFAIGYLVYEAKMTNLRDRERIFSDQQKKNIVEHGI